MSTRQDSHSGHVLLVMAAKADRIPGSCLKPDDRVERRQFRYND
jgi:hypothetical protein